MKTKVMKKAFTLIELMVVMVIIGMVSTAALVVLKDTGEVKALQYTKKVMTAMKNAVSQKEGDRVVTGFLNDFGTMPPNAYFLLNIEHDASFIHADNSGKLGRYRIDRIYKNDEKEHNISMPFLDKYESADKYYYDGTLKDNLGANPLESVTVSSMYIGHHGGYIGEGLGSDKSKAIKDGWGKSIDLKCDLNISDQGKERFMILRSGGSDGILGDDTPSPLKDEFNEFNSSGNIKTLYADDYNRSYRSVSFLSRNMNIQLDGLPADTNEIKVLIYSPMLYYADGSGGETCTEHNTTHAGCDGSFRPYIPYIPHVNGTSSTYKTAPDDNVSWHAGIVKYAFHYSYDGSGQKVNNDGNLSINNADIASVQNLTNSVDFTDDFYISAGEKQVVILKKSGSDFEFSNAYPCTFMPGRAIMLKKDGCE